MAEVEPTISLVQTMSLMLVPLITGIVFVIGFFKLTKK